MLKHMSSISFYLLLSPFYYFLKSYLPLRQLIEQAALGHELVVGALLGNLALVEDDDARAVAYGA